MDILTRRSRFALAFPLALGLVLAGCQRPVEVFSEPTPVAGPQPVILSSTDVGVVPAGTEVQASLNETLSTETAQVNDQFSMTLQTPILNAERETVIPVGARIMGRVTAVRESEDVATAAILRLEFNQIMWNNRTAPFAAEITETDVQREGRGTDEALRGAGIGAAAGAVLGTIVRGDIEGALAGAAIGAGAGTVISLGTANQQAVLETGSLMRLRVTEPVPVS